MSNIKLNGKTLSPAPFVSSSYEYSKSGEYIIGGFLIVTLSGKIISKTVLADLYALSALQSGNNCLSLEIGCGTTGGDFLKDASGKIRSVDFSLDDQPFLGSYTIQIAIETVNGIPVVSPDKQFLTSVCLKNADFIQSYSETININGDSGSIGLVDTALGLSKSFIKANGQISLVSLSQLICGKPEYTSIDNLVDIVSNRANSLLGLTTCEASALSAYNGWNKWIDTQTLEINRGAGSITWSFDMYMSPPGQANAPYAWADITTEDKYDLKKQTNNTSITGTIKGLSASSGFFLNNKTGTSERLSNAKRAYAIIQQRIANGTWPSETVGLSGTQGACPPIDPCKNSIEPTCFQRLSSNITTSVVSGEISFSCEFGSIDSCKPSEEAEIDVSVDETLSAIRHVELFVPNGRKSTIVNIGDTPSRVTITGKGTLKGCDTTKTANMRSCVQAEINKALSLYRGWIKIKENETFGTYSYSKTLEYIKCG